MNKTIEALLKTYVTRDHKALREEIEGYSKDTIAAALTDLITQYMNDKNSSTLREFMVVTLSGFQVYEEKLGYNGYRQSVATGHTEVCEAKPVNVTSKEGRFSRKLSGGGNFSDYTPERLKKDLELNPTMLLGGFADGILLYIISIPFSDLNTKLERDLNKQFHGKPRPVGTYLRSANFNFEDYKDSSELRIIYKSERLKSFSASMTSNFFEWLLKK